jgi:hypothetical protein
VPKGATADFSLFTPGRSGSDILRCTRRKRGSAQSADFVLALLCFDDSLERWAWPASIPRRIEKHVGTKISPAFVSAEVDVQGFDPELLSATFVSHGSEVNCACCTFNTDVEVGVLPDLSPPLPAYW